MKIVFFGTPEFALPSLEILLKEGYSINAVVTAPDKPRGRGQQVVPVPVKKFAVGNNIPVFQPENLKDEDFIAGLKKINPDIMVVVAYRILPPEVFTLPSQGAFNLHASLLPGYRGAAPINWAIINGEKETGVTTFFLEEKVDTGNIILQARCPIGENETAGELHDKLAEIGSGVVLHTVRLIEQGKAEIYDQDERLASRAPKLTKETGNIDWTKTAREVHNLVRGLSPAPAAYSFLDGKKLKLYRTEVLDEEVEREPGAIIRADDELHIAAGKGILRVTELQLEGKRRMSTPDFLRGMKLTVGQQLTRQ